MRKIRLLIKTLLNISGEEEGVWRAAVESGERDWRGEVVVPGGVGSI